MTQDTPAALPDPSFERMFNAAILDLAAINEALDLDPDDGGAAPILEAIASLKAQAATSAAGGATGDSLAPHPKLIDEQVNDLCDHFAKLVREKRAVHLARGYDAGVDYYIGYAAHSAGHAVKGLANARETELEERNKMLSRSLDESLFVNLQVAALAAQSPDSGAGPEEPKADPLREEQARKAAMWDALKTMFISRGCRIEFRDLTGGRWQSRHAWEVTVGRTTVTRTSLEFALWAACQLDAEGEGYGKDWPYSMPGKSTMSRLVPSDAAALARQGAQNG